MRAFAIKDERAYDILMNDDIYRIGALIMIRDVSKMLEDPLHREMVLIGFTQSLVAFTMAALED